MTSKSFSGFASDAARAEYRRRVAQQIVEAMLDDPTLAEDILLRGRIGLVQMNDKQLFETGVDAWGVKPRQEEVRAALH